MFICEIWLFDWYFPQFCTSRSVSEGPFDFEITRVDCIYVMGKTCCFQVILGLPGPRFPLTCMSKAVLTAPLERSTCPYQWSLLSFSMRSRSSIPSRASSSMDLMVPVSCGLTLQICLIIALSFRCRRWRLGFVTGQVSLTWSIALRTQLFAELQNLQNILFCRNLFLFHS